MTATSPLEIYNESHDDLQAIFRSRLMTQVLVALGSGSRSLSALRDTTGSSSQALIPKLRQLEALYYVEQVRGGYALTPVGRLVEPEIERLVTLMGVMERHRDFWAGHEIESIPPEFLREIGHLYNAKVVKDAEEDIHAVYTAFLTITRNASRICGVSSIMSPLLADALREAVMDGKQVELVISRELISGLAAEPYSTMRESLKGRANFGIYVSPQPVRFGMTVTDGYLSLGLYRRGKDIYNAALDLISTDAAAVAWGERLFQYYKAASGALWEPPE